MKIAFASLQFFVLYVLAIIGLFALVVFIEYEPSTYAFYAVLIGITYWRAARYSRKINYTISRGEQWGLTMGFWIAATLVDILISLVGMDSPVTEDTFSTWKLGILLIGLINILVISIIIRISITNERKKLTELDAT